MRNIITDIFRTIVLLMPVGMYWLVSIDASFWWVAGFLVVVLLLTKDLAEDTEDQFKSLYPFWLAGLGVLIAGYNALQPTAGHYVYLTLCVLFIQLSMFAIQTSQKK